MVAVTVCDTSDHWAGQEAHMVAVTVGDTSDHWAGQEAHMVTVTVGDISDHWAGQEAHMVAVTVGDTSDHWAGQEAHMVAVTVCDTSNHWAGCDVWTDTLTDVLYRQYSVLNTLVLGSLTLDQLCLWNVEREISQRSDMIEVVHNEDVMYHLSMP